MAIPKQKQPKAPRQRDPEKSTFDPYWNRHGGKVDTVDEYLDTALRELPGFFRGARIR